MINHLENYFLPFFDRVLGDNIDIVKSLEHIIAGRASSKLLRVTAPP